MTSAHRRQLTIEAGTFEARRARVFAISDVYTALEDVVLRVQPCMDFNDTLAFQLGFRLANLQRYAPSGPAW